jgi:predicted nucleic acid-binding protein
MAIYLLDTSVIIDAINQKRGRWQLLGSLVEAGDTLACSVVTLTEIYAGIRPKELVFTERFLDGLRHYELDSQLTRYAGLLKNEWAKKGRTTGRCRSNHRGHRAGSQPGVDDGQSQGFSNGTTRPLPAAVTASQRRYT